ncbi:MAG: hypothetical protein WA125_13340 [Desulfosporosinus sp.]
MRKAHKMVSVNNYWGDKQYYNGNYLQFINTEGLERVHDAGDYLPPSQLAMHLTYKDVWLDFFSSIQHLVKQPKSGDELTIDRDCCRNAKGQAVLRFSKQLIKLIEERKLKNNLPKTAKIRFIVYWRKEDAEHEIRIVLPELYFERTDDLERTKVIDPHNNPELFLPSGNIHIDHRLRPFLHRDT